MAWSRRSFVTGALAAPMLVKFGVLPVAAQTATAARQVVALQRLKVGDAVVTAISDGHLTLDVSQLANITAEEANRLLAAQFMPATTVTTGVNAYLVQSDGRNVLVDAGGAGLAPTLGNLVAGLEASGVKPEDVSDVLLTHLHLDHIGALVANGVATFPNARLHVHENDVAYFSSAENKAAAPEGFRVFFEKAAEALTVYGTKVNAFKGETDVVPGIAAREMFGHTPGHCGYRIGNGDDALLVCGDVVHIGAVQIARPGVGVVFDVDPETAIATRRKVLEAAASERMRIAGMHISFPGVGRVVKLAEGEGYDFEPSPWTYALD